MKKKENEKDEDIKEEEPKDRRCFQCGDMGHVRRDCPEYRHLKQRAAGAPGQNKNRCVEKGLFARMVFGESVKYEHMYVP